MRAFLDGFHSDAGGPAYPIVEHPSPGEARTIYASMSLRDYFAGQALAQVYRRHHIGEHAAVAADAYAQADAMLAARGQKAKE